MRDQSESVHSVWRRLYASPDFLRLRCSAMAEGFDVYAREELVCDFLAWAEDDCQSPQCRGFPKN